MSDDKPQKTDRYRDTVFLPKTAFPMKAGLPQKEPELLKRWEEIDLYSTLREQPPAARNSCCMTARPMPTATSTSATRSTRS